MRNEAGHGRWGGLRASITGSGSATAELLITAVACLVVFVLMTALVSLRPANSQEAPAPPSAATPPGAVGVPLDGTVTARGFSPVLIGARGPTSYRR